MCVLVSLRDKELLQLPVISGLYIRLITVISGFLDSPFLADSGGKEQGDGLGLMKASTTSFSDGI